MKHPNDLAGLYAITKSPEMGVVRYSLYIEVLVPGGYICNLFSAVDGRPTISQFLTFAELNNAELFDAEYEHEWKARVRQLIDELRGAPE